MERQAGHMLIKTGFTDYPNPSGKKLAGPGLQK